MKTVLIMSIFFISSLAQASFYRTECSNNRGTLKIYQGHTSQQPTATSITGNPRKPIKKIVELNYREFDFSYSDKISIETVNTSKCVDDIMYYSSRSIFAEKVTITKSDGGLFDKSIDGITTDRKSLPAYLICKNVMNSRPRPMKCPK